MRKLVYLLLNIKIYLQYLHFSIYAQMTIFIILLQYYLLQFYSAYILYFTQKYMRKLVHLLLNILLQIICRN